MPTTIFDWVARTAMLVMAGLVTLSILGAIAAMTEDPGTRFSVSRERPVIEGEQTQEPPTAQTPPATPEEGNAGSADGPVAGQGQGQGQDQGQGVAIAAPPPSPEDKAARSLEAIAYALMALVGIGALGVLMLWSILREMRAR